MYYSVVMVIFLVILVMSIICLFISYEVMKATFKTKGYAIAIILSSIFIIAQICFLLIPSNEIQQYCYLALLIFLILSFFAILYLFTSFLKNRKDINNPFGIIIFLGIMQVSIAMILANYTTGNHEHHTSVLMLKLAANIIYLTLPTFAIYKLSKNDLNHLNTTREEDILDNNPSGDNNNNSCSSDS